MNKRISIYVCLFIFLYGSAAAYGSSQEVARQMLQRLKIQYDTDSFFEAIESGNDNVVKLLLRAGMSPDTAKTLSVTGLMVAAEKGDTGMAKVLIEAAANVNLKNQLRGKTALMLAAENGNRDLVEMLIHAGADVNAKTEKHVYFGINYPGGNTALLYAAGSGNLECVRALLKAGADPKIKNDDGYDPITWAGKNGKTDVLQTLEAAAAKQGARAGSPQDALQ